MTPKVVSRLATIGPAFRAPAGARFRAAGVQVRWREEAHVATGPRR